MSENLKVIKVLHQLLMVTTAAILAFSLRPDLSQKYRAALDELAAFKQLSVAGWSNYVAQRYSATANEDVKFVRGLVRQARLRVSGSPNIVIPVFGDQVPNPESRLLDWDTFFAKPQRIGITTLTTSERRTLLKQFAQWAAARNPSYTIIAMNLSVSSTSGPQYPGGSLMLDWLNRSPSGTSRAPLYLITDERGLQPTYVVFSYSIRSEVGKFAIDWLRNDTFGRKLVDPRTGVIFPNLKTFWHQINQDNPDQATLFLQEELEANTRGTLSFFGIPVERSLAISAGPVLLFCILLFLGLHLGHFRSLPADDEGTRNYPWVGLFHSWLAVVATYASLLILSVLANAWLIYRYGQWGEWSTRIGAIAASLVLVSGTWALYEVHAIRKRFLLQGN